MVDVELVNIGQGLEHICIMDVELVNIGQGLEPVCWLDVELVKIEHLSAWWMLNWSRLNTCLLGGC